MTLLQRCGIMLEPQEGLTSKDVIAAAINAEKLGFGYILRSDHLLPTSGRRGISSPECWTTLGGIAVSTSKICFGPLVSPVGFRNPALLFKMASTVHSLSGGRLQLGIGMGWYQDEYKSFGFDYPSFGIRREQLLEEARIIRSLIDEGKVEFAGKYFSVRLEDYSAGRGIRLVIGGKSPSLARAASKYADEWNILAPSRDELKRLKDNVKNELTISQMGPFFIGETIAKIREKIARRLRLLQVNMQIEEYIHRLRLRNAMIGTPADFKDQLNERIAWGIQKFYFQTLEPQDEETLVLLSDCLKSL